MNNKRFLLSISIFLLLSIIIHFYSGNSLRVENAYSKGIYPPIATFLRYLLGWVPFSLGDILYGLFAIWLGFKCIKTIRAIIRRQVTLKDFSFIGIKVFSFCLLIYIYFNIFWGINYNRKGIADQLQLKMETYSVEDLKNINALLLEKVNISKQALINKQETYPSFKELSVRVKKAYDTLKISYPFLKYHPISIKPSLWGWLGNYAGFWGYYNPFTGEAQVNTTVPKFLQPFTTCHEVAHQLGYAKEMEANFVGYLAARASSDTLLHYSIYLDLFVYSNRNLYNSDSLAARFYTKQLLPEVTADLKEWTDFSKKHRNIIGGMVWWVYDKYLQRNQQPQGMHSYDEVTSFLIAYYKKFGEI